MLIDGNNMIELLSLPEWDDRILDMLEEFGEKRPVYDPNDTTIFIKPAGYDIEMMFDARNRTEKQKEMAGQGNLYFNQIILKNITTIKLPFSIEMGDNYETISKKIGKKADYTNKYDSVSRHWLLDDGEKQYFLNCDFTDENLITWNSIWFTLFDKEMNYRGLIPNE